MSAAADRLIQPTLLPLRERHLSQVLSIEQASYNYPWPQRIFADCILHGYSCWVLSYRDRIDVYGIMAASTVAQEAHLFNLCVRPQLRRRGLARAMLQHLMRLALERGASTMLLEVRPSNTAAISLYQSMRFKQVGRRPNYYRACPGREDALLFVRELTPRRHGATLSVATTPPNHPP